MSKALWVYKPFSPLALKSALEEEQRAWMWRLYMAQIGEGLCRAAGYKVTPFAEIIGLVKQDTRSGRQIVDDLRADMKKKFGRKEG